MTPPLRFNWSRVGSISFARLMMFSPSGESVVISSSPRSLNIQTLSPFLIKWILLQRAFGTAVRSSQIRSPLRASRQRSSP